MQSHLLTPRPKLRLDDGQFTCSAGLRQSYNGLMPAFLNGQPRLAVHFMNDIAFVLAKLGEAPWVTYPFYRHFDPAEDVPQSDGRVWLPLRFTLGDVPRARRDIWPSWEFCHILVQAVNRQIGAGVCDVETFEHRLAKITGRAEDWIDTTAITWVEGRKDDRTTARRSA